MSETATKFEIEMDDGTIIGRDDILAHADHGPMRVDSIRAGPHHKTADLKSERGPQGLELTDEELREAWGETLALDPFDLHDPGTAKFTNEGISAEDQNVEVDITVEGPEEDAEKVLMHAIDEVNKAMQAMRDGQPPSECEGAPFTIDWEAVFQEAEDGN